MSKNPILDTLMALTDPEAIIVVHRPLVRFTGSLEAAMLLSQMLYWTPRATLADGWIAKTDEMWRAEIPGVSRYALRNARNILEKEGILQTRIGGWAGQRCTFYRLDVEALTGAWQAFVTDDQAAKCETELTPEDEGKSETELSPTGQSAKPNFEDEAKCETERSNTEITSHEITSTEITLSPEGDKETSKPLTGKNLVKAELETFFSEITRLPKPDPTTQKAARAASVGWWQPLLALADLVDDDIDRAKALIVWAVGHFDTEGITIASPRSIEKTARAEFARRMRLQEEKGKETDHDDGNIDARNPGTNGGAHVDPVWLAQLEARGNGAGADTPT